MHTLRPDAWVIRPIACVSQRRNRNPCSLSAASSTKVQPSLPSAWPAPPLPQQQPTGAESLIISSPTATVVLHDECSRHSILTQGQDDRGLHLTPVCYHHHLSQQAQADVADLVNSVSLDEVAEATAQSQPHPQSLPAGVTGLARLLGRDLGISQDKMQQILLRWPPIEQLDIEYVSMSIHSLAAFLTCKPSQAAVAISREHRLLHASLFTLQQQADSLVACLQVQRRSVLRLAQNCPAVLFEQPKELHSQVQAVADAMKLSVQQVVEAAQEESWLLKAPPSKISHRVQQLGEALGINPGPPLLSHPRLVCMATEDIASKLQHMGKCLQLSPADIRQLVTRYPSLLNFSTQRMGMQVSSLCQHIPLLQLQGMVREEPSLLARNARNTARELHHLQQLLCCSKEQALELVARRPSLLTRSHASLKASHRALSIWRFSPEEKRDLILAQPLLLRLSGQEVHGRCRWLRSLMLSNPYFHRALRRLPVRMLGIVIMHLPHAWSRLQYLAESSQETGSDIMEVVQVKQQAFQWRHPGYYRWLMWKCAQQGCAIPWRGHVFHNQQSAPAWRKRSAGSSHEEAAAQAAPGFGYLPPAQQWPGPGRPASLASLAPDRLAGAPRRRGGHAPSRNALGLPQHAATTHVGELAPPNTSAHSELRESSKQPSETDSTRPEQQEVRVHEARTLLIGGRFVHKPKRVVPLSVSDSHIADEDQGIS